MPEQVLRFGTYIFLALLYLFFLRVLRAVWSELREPKAAVALTPGPGGDRTPAADQTTVAATVAEMPWRTRRSQGERLWVLEPEERRGQEFDLGDELTVGRAAGCSVALPDDTFVSQLHARVFRRDGDLWVEDLGSTNGTFLNGKKVSAPVVMRRGDRLDVGKTVLEMMR